MLGPPVSGKFTPAGRGERIAEPTRLHRPRHLGLPSEISEVSPPRRRCGTAPSSRATPTQRSPRLRRRLNTGMKPDDLWPPRDDDKPFDRITVDPKVMNGRPYIRGMRLTVRRVVEAVACTRIGRSFGRNTRAEDDDIRQSARVPAGNLDDEVLMLEAG